MFILLFTLYLKKLTITETYSTIIYSILPRNKVMLPVILEINL